MSLREFPSSAEEGRPYFESSPQIGQFCLDRGWAIKREAPAWWTKTGQSGPSSSDVQGKLNGQSVVGLTLAFAPAHHSSPT